MSGLAGHLNHLYDNRELSFAKIKNILTLASQGKLHTTEKIDGFNIYLTFTNGKALAARNKGDIKSGGMDFEALSQRDFAGGDEIKKVYLEALKSFQKAVQQLPKKTIKELFQDGSIFYNTEILGPSANNVVNYDDNIITIHKTGHMQYNPETKKIEPVDLSPYSKILDKSVDALEQISSKHNFKIRKAAAVKLGQIGDKSDLKIAKARIEKLLQKIGLSNGNTIEDYLRSVIEPKVDKAFPEADQTIKELIVNNILGKAKLNGPDGLPKGIPSEFRKRISDTKKNSKKIIDKAMYPIEDIIHDFSVAMLEGLESSYIVNNGKEIKRLRGEVAQAIKAIKDSSNKDAMEILQRQLKKIKHHDNINTAVEGVVFEIDGQTYKFTGNFAPINQILGLFKYGRGKKIPPMQSIKEVEEDETKNKIIAVLPGGYKPPHAGHFQMAKYFADMPEVDLVYILISQKPRAGHSDSKRIEITKDIAKKIWKLYTAGQPKYKIAISKEPSPVSATYEFMKKMDRGDTIILGQSEKEIEAGDTRYENAQEFADEQNYGIKVATVSTPTFSKGISGTELRELIADEKEKSFKKYLPKHLNPEQKELVWQIVNEGENETVEELMATSIRETKKDYQATIKAKHPARKKRLLTHGEQDAGEAGSPFKEKPSMERSKSAPPGAGGVLEEEELDEMSAMGAGAVQGAPGTKKDKKIDRLLKERKKQWRHVMVDRDKFLEELKLRGHIRRIVSEIRKDKKKVLKEEQRLRGYVRRLILQEVEVGDKSPHRMTGINALETLLKKIMPTIEDGYTSLTTSKEQRDSYKNHIIKATQNTLIPSAARAEAGKEEEEKFISIDEQEDELDLNEPEEDADVKVAVKKEKKPDEFEKDDERKFIDIDQKEVDPEEKKVEDFTIEGEDKTGRNAAMAVFDMIEKNIVDAYDILDNPEDKEVFYDYLLVNLKLYFQKFEDQLAGGEEEAEVPDVEDKEF